MQLPNHVQETSTSTGTGDFTLDGAATGFLAFGSQLADGTVVFYSIYDDSGNVETGVGTYRTGPARLERDTVYQSTNGGAKVNWVSGTKNVVVALPGSTLASLLDPAAGTGFLVRSALHTYVERAFQTVSGILSWSNADGVSGNPTLDDSGLDGRYVQQAGDTVPGPLTLQSALTAEASITAEAGLSSQGDVNITKASPSFQLAISSGIGSLFAELTSVGSGSYKIFRTIFDTARPGVFIFSKERPVDGDEPELTWSDSDGGEIWHDGNLSFPGNTTDPGSFTLPSGHIVNYGTTSSVGLDSTVSVTFDTAFPNAMFGAVVTPLHGPTGGVGALPKYQNPSTTGMDVVNDGDNAAPMFYVAVGH